MLRQDLDFHPHLLANNNQFHRVRPTPEILGFHDAMSARLALGHKRKFGDGVWMSAVGGKADVIRLIADMPRNARRESLSRISVQRV